MLLFSCDVAYSSRQPSSKCHISYRRHNRCFMSRATFCKNRSSNNISLCVPGGLSSRSECYLFPTANRHRYRQRLDSCDCRSCCAGANIYLLYNCRGRSNCCPCQRRCPPSSRLHLERTLIPRRKPLPKLLFSPPTNLYQPLRQLALLIQLTQVTFVQLLSVLQECTASVIQ